jgi:two-component system CheB/CheR fusion protein
MAARKGGAGGENHAFEALLDYLKRNRGFDFTGYKRSTLMRRVSKRMGEVGIRDYVGYQDYLQVHPDEFEFLFNTILINVTAFFRDPPVWDFLAAQILPALVAARKPGAAIRVWSAGCASGEEAYTLAMLLCEALGEAAYRRRVKIYATDVDKEALSAARRAVYSASDVESVPKALLEKYFERQGARHPFRSELRRTVIFGRHDLVQDAPISRIDLLVCRNVLMYLNAETQAHVLARLHFALNPGGHLLLGKAEMLLSHADLFTPVELKHRLFAKAPRLGAREQLALMAETGNSAPAIQLDDQERVRQAALDASPVAQIVIDAAGALALANVSAQHAFALGPADYGRPLQDLEISYRPIELRSLIERAHQEGRPVRSGDVERPLPDGQTQHLEVEVAPLRDADDSAIGVSATFVDRTELARMRDDLERTHQELEHSNEELHSANEELETTNEELQSTNEELETTNEELQSGNEELETMNEELQSTNEELRAINEQLQLRTQQLNLASALQQAILGGMRSAVVVVDRHFRVQRWEPKMEELWGLRASEVEGSSLFGLDIGLPVEELRPAIRGCLRGDSEVPELKVAATNRRGKPIRCTVTATPLRQDDHVEGVILLMERIDDGDSDPPPAPARRAPQPGRRRRKP